MTTRDEFMINPLNSAIKYNNMRQVAGEVLSSMIIDNQGLIRFVVEIQVFLTLLENHSLING